MVERERQLAYSDIQSAMHDETGRRTKARKIIEVLRHFTGRDSFEGMNVLDLGCSTGFIADELREAGATAFGVDIDVPGLAAASKRFGDRVGFVCGDGEQLPFPDESVDLVVFNQIYEHVVDPDAVMRDLRRVLKPGGVAYLGLGNRLQVMEPHHKLPFLSWLPYGAADQYMRLAGKGEAYHERFRIRRNLQRLCTGLNVWDYTYTVIAEPDRFSARDMVPGALERLPRPLVRLLDPIIPTYLWVGSKDPLTPLGGPVRVAPERVRTY